MAAAAPLRRQEATYLDGTWGWGKEDPETGEDLYNISSVVRTPMAFEEEAWDKPQHRYAWEQVRAMERAELDYRLDLHSIYGQPWSWFNVDYIRQEHPGAQDPVRVLLEDTQTNDNAVGEEGYKERHILRKEHVDRGLSEPDVHMGDSFTPEEQVEWARQSRNRPQHDVGWDADDVYGHFHMRQYDRLLNLGRRRQAEARSFMSEYEKREALRYAYQAKERSADLLPGDAGTEEPAELTGAGMQSGGGAGFDHRGRSAQQQVIAGSGRPGAPPGWHYMSTGVMMRDAD